MYKVIKYFTDLQDNNHAYNAGDVFPRAGLKVSDTRLKELSGSANRQGTSLIEEIAEKVEPDVPVVKPVKNEEKRRTRKKE